MTYRRGFQRIYLLVATAWFLVVLVMVASNGWIWTPWRITPTTWDALAAKYGAIAKASSPDELQPITETRNEIVISASRKALWVAVLALPIPIFGYLVLFYVLPWVYRGFKTEPIAPGTQI